MIHLEAKSCGETPLDVLERVRARAGLAGVKMCYAGRLDPMAEGLMVILSAPDHLEKVRYCGLDKTYEAEILLGVGSDTGDALGRLHADLGALSRVLPSPALPSPALPAAIPPILAALCGDRLRRAPAWSAASVGGRTMSEHRRAGRDVAPPLIPMRVDSAEASPLIWRDPDDLREEVTGRIRCVNGPFRQDEAIADWRGVLPAYASAIAPAPTPDTLPATAPRLSPIASPALPLLPLLPLRVTCGSGTYIRTLAEEIGAALGLPALLYRLRRTRVGPWRLPSSGESPVAACLDMG